MTYVGLNICLLKMLFRVIYSGIHLSSYQQLASFSQGKSKHIYKKSKATALIKYYYLIGQPIMIYNRRSAVGSRRSLMPITALCAACHCHARVIQYYCVRSNIRNRRSIRSCHYCTTLLCGIAPRVQS